ncbi:MAG: ABC transporter ATP-binding protein [Lachnospiraceae bacterium]|nr:ABC transporter ATP-binding protein [Lachnospiraceae bacterium]
MAQSIAVNLAGAAVPPGPAVSCRHISKNYGILDGEHSADILKDVNLDIEEGDFRILIGKSGCGKSTLLNILAGLSRPTKGEVLVYGNKVRKAGKNRGVIFQNADAALFPWKTVRGNVEYGLKMQKTEKKKRRETAEKYIELVGLKDHADKYPDELSGGMKQRLQIARALAGNPDILIMDEPFGALDAHTRRILQSELLHIWKETGKTIIFVTHDISEAILLGKNISIMSMSPNATIYQNYEVDLSYPRNDRSREFLDLRDRVQAHFDYGAGI